MKLKLWFYAFSQHASANDMSAGGALLCGIEHDLEIGDTIGVQAGEKKTRCKVVRSDHVFHNFFHRYFALMPKIALTLIQQLFILSYVDG